MPGEGYTAGQQGQEAGRGWAGGRRRACVAATEWKAKARGIPKKGSLEGCSGPGVYTPHPPLHEIFINSTLHVGGLHVDYGNAECKGKKLRVRGEQPKPNATVSSSVQGCVWV